MDSQFPTLVNLRLCESFEIKTKIEIHRACLHKHRHIGLLHAIVIKCLPVILQVGLKSKAKLSQSSFRVSKARPWYKNITVC